LLSKFLTIIGHEPAYAELEKSINIDKIKNFFIFSPFVIIAINTR
jgi:hypothetical protein